MSCPKQKTKGIQIWYNRPTGGHWQCLRATRPSCSPRPICTPCLCSFKTATSNAANYTKPPSHIAYTLSGSPLFKHCSAMGHLPREGGSQTAGPGTWKTRQVLTVLRRTLSATSASDLVSLGSSRSLEDGCLWGEMGEERGDVLGQKSPLPPHFPDAHFTLPPHGFFCLLLG